MAVVQIEISDLGGEHVELLSDGSARLFGREKYDADNGAFTVTERQLGILIAAINARADLKAQIS